MSAAHQCVFDVILGGKHPHPHKLWVRPMFPLETFPTLEVGLDKLNRLDREWVWVAQDTDGVCGVLVAAPCHGLAFLYRVVMRDGMPPSYLLALLRGAMRDMRSRGVLGFMTFLDPALKQQQRLLCIIQRLGGKQVGGEHIVIASPMPKEGV